MQNPSEKLCNMSWAGHVAMATQVDLPELDAMTAYKFVKRSVILLAESAASKWWIKWAEP